MILTECLVVFAAFIFINIMFSIGSEDCSFISSYFKNKKIYVLNEAETVEFLPTEYSYVDSGWDNECIDTQKCVVGNKIEYKNKRMRTLSNTELGISDEELNESLHQSFSNNEILTNVISVFTNRYVVRTHSAKVLVYSICYGKLLEVINPNCTNNYLIKYQMSKVKGLICKVAFVSGVRSRIKCDNVALFLNAIDEDGNLDCETKCLT